VAAILEHLGIRFGSGVRLVAMGNWRVVAPDTARLLAVRGALLVHTAPVPGVKDWSDLRIAVAAGMWLGGAQAGDVLEIVTDDAAFDAVGDLAACRGAVFRRLSYRSLSGEVQQVRRIPDNGRPRRRRPRSRRRRR
jgi:hypothetical protein